MPAFPLPLEDWHKRLQSPTLADVILHPLMYNGYNLRLKGDSMRIREKPNDAVIDREQSRCNLCTSLLCFPACSILLQRAFTFPELRDENIFRESVGQRRHRFPSQDPDSLGNSSEGQWSLRIGIFCIPLSADRFCDTSFTRPERDR
jgi:hypothetical protein